MTFQVCPEQAAEEIGEAVQAGVVQGGLAFLEVVHEQIADGTADQPVPVDQLLRCALPDRAQLPQSRRRIGAEDTHRAQYPVEQMRGARSGAERHGLSVEQFEHVADGDVGNGAALGRQDQRRSVGRAGHRG
ncbi:hypothetical protein [Mycobacterium intracellulare]|uniref:hypothetical protein n=1 Tax=Mycobacterium intracellulare TaxID=1767 RepID=UPI001E655DD6|nr:hypothetical protein [Mycobacterium intracellulare]